MGHPAGEQKQRVHHHDEANGFATFWQVRGQTERRKNFRNSWARSAQTQYGARQGCSSGVARRWRSIREEAGHSGMARASAYRKDWPLRQALA